MISSFFKKCKNILHNTFTLFGMSRDTEQVTVQRYTTKRKLCGHPRQQPRRR